MLITYRIYSYCGHFVLMRSDDKLIGLISLIAVQFSKRCILSHWNISFHWPELATNGLYRYYCNYWDLKLQPARTLFEAYLPSIQFRPSNLLLTWISNKTCFNFATCIVIAFFPSSNPLQLIQTNKHKWKSS